MMNINHSLKYKSNNIINIYSTLTPKEAINPNKAKNLLISPNLKSPKDNIKQSKTNMVKNNSKNKNNNKDLSNEAIKKNILINNVKSKGSLSTTNLNTNYGFFKTKKLKTTKSLFNKLNRFGNSIKMNIKLPKHNIFNNNINNSKSKEKIISSILEDKGKKNHINIFRKSMSHNKMIFPNMNEKKMEKIKEEYEYTGSEPNSRQKSLDKFNENKNNIRKKEIKKAIKQLLTVNTDFDIGTFNKIKFNFMNWTNNNNVSKENIKRELINFSSRKNSKIKNENNNNEKIFKENFSSENVIKNNNIKINNSIKNNNNVINNLSRLNMIQNSINNTVRINSTSKSKNKIKNIQIKNKYNKELKAKNRNKNKEDKSNIIKPKFKSPQHIADKGNNIILLYSNDSKNKSKSKTKSTKAKTVNKNININININDIKTTNININNININNEMRKQIIDENINPVTNININNINSNMNNVINYITNFNATNLNNFIKENNENNMNNNNKEKNNDSNKTYKNAKSAKNIINQGLNLKNILNLQPKKNMSNINNNYFDAINSNNNIIQNTIEKNEQRQNYFSPDNNRLSMFTTSNNLKPNNSNNKKMGHKNQIELIKNIRDKKLSKNIRNNIISNIIKVEEVINQKNKKIKKILSSSYSQKNELNSNQKIKVRLKNQEQNEKNEINNNNINDTNMNVNKLINKHINKFKFGSISTNDMLEQINQYKNIKKSKIQKYYERLKSNEPVKPYKVIKYFYNYLKANELEELKKLKKKKGMVYYMGEILPRINKDEKTHIIVFNTTDNIKNIITKDNIIKDNNQIIHCTSCHNLRSKKSKDFYKLYNRIKNANPNIDGKFNFNDREGYYTFKKGYHLNYRYEIIGLLGKGTFGEAVQCYDHKNKEVVCIKIINARKEFQTQAMVEIKILTSISLNDTDNESGNVKFYQYFNFRSHICLVFELLGQNLFESLQTNNFNGLDLSMIRCYTTELLFSLMFLRKLKIIHCDLKPENILLVPKSKNKIKIIDFGSSCFEYEITYTYIQSRFYRAPEVILDLGYGFEIDIWSMGCILCELYTGNPIFPGSDEMEQINYIMKCLGPPDEAFKENSFKARFFFDSEINLNYEEFENKKKYSKKEVKNNLKRYFNVYNNENMDSQRDENSQFINFIDFISQCLEWNPKKRLTPEEGLMHPFILENLTEEEISYHKSKIKKIQNKISNNEIFTSREKEKIKELSISSINNFDNNTNNILKHEEKKQAHNLKKNKSFVRPPLNLSFLKIEKEDINSVKEGKNKINLEINNINIYTNSNSDLQKINPKRNNHSISNYRHYSTNENNIYNIKKFDLNRKKQKKNNLLNIIANIDFNLKKIIKRGHKGKNFVKKDSNFKYNKK